MKNDFAFVGKPVVRQDALEKVTGTAKFADDINFPGQLHGVMIRIPSSHAKILSINYSKIKNRSSLFEICDSTDIPGAKIYGHIKKDQPIFSFDKIVTSGDVIAMLLGESAYELEKIKSGVVIKYKSLPVLDDPRKALSKKSPLIHPEYKSNLIVHYPLRKGNIEKGFKEADHILEQTYTTPFIEHAYIEPEAVIALPLEGNKGIKIIGSIQNPHTTRKFVAAVLNYPLAKVRVVQAELGGSFGGKDDTMNILASRAAVGAYKTKRPVKILYSREDSILESYKRHPYILKYKVGYKDDGRLTAMKINILADGGAYSSMSPFVTWRTVVQATGPYEIENVWTDVRAVYTNNPYTGAMRGFGSPQPIFAEESIMDEIAIALNISPGKIRQINGYKSGSITASGQVLRDHDVNLKKVLSTAVTKSGFNRKWNKYQKENSKKKSFYLPGKKINLILKKNQYIKNSENIRKGIGLSISFRGCSLGAEGIDAAAAYLSVLSDGTAYLLSGLAENGQGLKTTFSIIAAEVLGISPDKVYYLEHDTGLIADSGPTVASRSTLMGGSAVKNAAETIKKRLIDTALKYYNIKSYRSLHYADNWVYPNGRKREKMSIADLCGLAYSKGVNLSAIGWYSGPDVYWDEKKGQGDAYFTYVYGCQVAEVSLNTITGEVSVNKIWAVHDPGKIINLLGARGQVYGGVTQGAGYGLWEKIESNSGFIAESNLDQYLIPTSKDIGEIEEYFIEGKDKYGAWGAKSLGEPTLELTAAAIANAVRNAAGKRFFNLPLNIEEIILGRKLSPKNVTRGSLI